MKIFTIISFSLLISQQLQVDGNLKVTGDIDASGNPITNVGAPQAVTHALNLQNLNKPQNLNLYIFLQLQELWKFFSLL